MGFGVELVNICASYGVGLARAHIIGGAECTPLFYSRSLAVRSHNGMDAMAEKAPTQMRETRVSSFSCPCTLGDQPRCSSDASSQITAPEY